MKLLGFAMFALLFIAVAAPSRASVPRGSYQQSCHGAYVQHGWLYAECRYERVGMSRYKKTRLKLPCDGDVVNRGGNLECEHK